MQAREKCRYYCTTCNHYFCIDKQWPLIDQDLVIRMKNNSKAKTMDTSSNDSFTSIYCVMDCFRFAHPNAFGDPTLFDSLQLDVFQSNRESIPKVSTTKKREKQSLTSSANGHSRGSSATVLPSVPRKKPSS